MRFVTHLVDAESAVGRVPASPEAPPFSTRACPGLRGRVTGGWKAFDSSTGFRLPDTR